MLFLLKRMLLTLFLIWTPQFILVNQQPWLWIEQNAKYCVRGSSHSYACIVHNVLAQRGATVRLFNTYGVNRQSKKKVLFSLVYCIAWITPSMSAQSNTPEQPITPKQYRSYHLDHAVLPRNCTSLGVNPVFEEIPLLLSFLGSSVWATGSQRILQIEPLSPCSWSHGMVLFVFPVKLLILKRWIPGRKLGFNILIVASYYLMMHYWQ